MLTNTKQFEVQQGPLTGSIVAVTAATYSFPEYVTRINCDTTSNAIAVTLPDPSLFAGRAVTVFLKTDPSTNDVTINGEGLSEITLDAANEYSILWSDGQDWFEIASNHA